MVPITVIAVLTLAFAPISLFFLITANQYSFYKLLNVAILTLAALVVPSRELITTVWVSSVPTSLNVPLNCLRGKKWTLRSYADDPKFSDYQMVVQSTSSVNAKSVLTLSLAPGGGFAGIISKGD